MQIRELIMSELGLLLQKTNKSHVKACQQSLGLSEMTMNKYLSGNGSKIDVYQNILNHLRNVA